MTRVPPDSPVTPRVWQQSDFNVLTNTVSGNLADMQDDTDTRTITDVCCAYCNLPVIWDRPGNSNRLCDLHVYPNYHSCQQRQNEYGVCNPGFYSLTQQRQVFADIVNLGMKWVRVDMTWSSVQPTNSSTYNWTSYDTFVQAANEYGVKVLFILDYGVSWASGNSDNKYPPTNPGDFATFAAAVVNRYSPLGVKYYEIWNEPNLAIFWKPAPDPAAYTMLLKAAYAAIKNADPSSTVLLCGLASAGANDATHYTAYDFLAGVYAAGGGNYFDAANYHPYSWPAPAGNGQWLQLFKMRDVMRVNHDSLKKIWFTEYGFPSGGGGNSVAESDQAIFMTDAINLHRSYGWAGPMFVYNYKDGNGSLTPPTENYFGILRNNGTQKPLYQALKTAIAAKY